jgi:hypothetical protein
MLQERHESGGVVGGRESIVYELPLRDGWTQSVKAKTQPDISVASTTPPRRKSAELHSDLPAACGGSRRIAEEERSEARQSAKFRMVGEHQ